eukprot:CAMPEP_0170623538 /NCGR_PEP_ID=MMETSP0224-20130122/29753_1 /TAXON_ID=285029 /ORGANISM="Togula jolla, Strain CCCM 725" /LENGTH=52 /DNA_ID=CAMNT_0010950001 /DNA_START=126 /DNA_END=280 /DNA_ORIENTATION=-
MYWLSNFRSISSTDSSWYSPIAAASQGELRTSQRLQKQQRQWLARKASAKMA